MSPYVADPLCRGGAECSQRDESGIVWGLGLILGVWRAHRSIKGGWWGFTCRLAQYKGPSGATSVMSREGPKPGNRSFSVFSNFVGALDLINWDCTPEEATSSDCFALPWWGKRSSCKILNLKERRIKEMTK